MEQELQFLLYDLPDDSAKVQVVVRDETVWMTPKAMGVLFGVQAPAISKHLKNIFESGELNPEVVISKMETTTQHGAIAGKTQTSETNFYNLDAIISVGYRVNSTKATRNAFTMSEFANSVNEFLSFRKYEVLPHKGLISREAAEEKAHAEYEIYNRTQPIESDFDHFLELEAEVKKGED